MHLSVGRSESARADIRGQLTVVCQISRCLAGQTLEDQGGDLEGHSLMHGQAVELAGSAWCGHGAARRL